MPIIIVAPIAARPGYFAATCNGRQLCRNRQPLLDGARALLEAGYSADAAVVMRHAGSQVDALRSTIAAAAKLTVNEDHMRFARWKAFPSGAVTRPEKSDPWVIGELLPA
jgi:hypothetical protein